MSRNKYDLRTANGTEEIMELKYNVFGTSSLGFNVGQGPGKINPEAKLKETNPIRTDARTIIIHLGIDLTLSTYMFNINLGLYIFPMVIRNIF